MVHLTDCAFPFLKLIISCMGFSMKFLESPSHWNIFICFCSVGHYRSTGFQLCCTAHKHPTLEVRFDLQVKDRINDANTILMNRLSQRPASLFRQNSSINSFLFFFNSVVNNFHDTAYQPTAAKSDRCDWASKEQGHY